MIILDYKDTRPIYEQIVEKFKMLILKGVLQKDEQIPSIPIRFKRRMRNWNGKGIYTL